MDLAALEGGEGNEKWEKHLKTLGIRGTTVVILMRKDLVQIPFQLLIFMEVGITIHSCFVKKVKDSFPNPQQDLHTENLGTRLRIGLKHGEAAFHLSTMMNYVLLFYS